MKCQFVSLNNNSMEQPKIERILRLMQYLTGNINYTVDDLAESLGISRRTVFRYLDTFKSAGFVVQKMEGGIYRMASLHRKDTDLSKIVYFTEEEAYLVSNLIDRLDNTNALKQALKRKLAAVYDATNLTDYIDCKGNSASIGALSSAIRTHSRVILHHYASSHSGETKDYYIEPFKFSTNYIDVWAFDVKDGLNKRFKISRIGGVEIMTEKWQFEQNHHPLPMDVFRIHSEKSWHIKLRLTLQARNLLVEDFPLAERGLTKSSENNIWYYDGDVRGLDGVGRFVLGLPGEVAVVEGEELKSYIDSARSRY